MLGLTAIVSADARAPLFDAARSAVVLYIGITGLVFALLLSGLQESLDTHIPWVNFVVHKLIPIVLVVDWIIDPPRHRVRVRVAAAWLAYPVAYFVYTLVRGAYVDWYPYPFLDADRLGYGGVILRSVFLAAGMAFAAVAVVVIGNRFGARHDAVTSPAPSAEEVPPSERS